MSTMFRIRFRIRRQERDRRPALENLETRDVPAVINPLAAWAGALRAAAVTPNDVPIGGDNTTTGPLTPNFPGGTTDPTTPGIPSTPNPNYPGRTTFSNFLRTGSNGGVVTTPPVTVPGVTTPSVTTPNVTIPGGQIRFNFGNSPLRTNALTPNFPGGTTDPTTPGIPSTPNPNFPGRTTFNGFLRNSSLGGGTVNVGGGGGSISTPGVTVPSTNFRFNTSFLRTGNLSTGVGTPGVTTPTVTDGNIPGSIGTPGVTNPGDLTTPSLPTPGFLF